jgi:hypothetical protein
VIAKTGQFSLAASGENEFTVACDAGQKALSGGFASSNAVIAAHAHPSADGGSWVIYLVNLSSSAGAGGVALHRLPLLASPVVLRGGGPGAAAARAFSDSSQDQRAQFRR